MQTESGIYRNPLSIDSQELTHSTNPYIITLQDAFLQTVKNHKNKSFLGTRNEHGLYVFKTYQEIYDWALYIGSGLINLDMVPVISEFKDYNLKFVGIFSKNREEYTITDLACILFGFTSIPFYDTLGTESLEFILNQTNLITIFCSKETIESLKNLENLGKLKYIVCFDNCELNSETKEFEKLEKKNIKIYNFKDIVDKGRGQTQKPVKITPNTLYTFSYTSGTTGLPKGVMLSHKNFISVITGLKQVVQIKPEDIHISYLPMAHVFEKMIDGLCMYEGATIGFYSGDVLKLKDDLQALRPTIFASVPRLYNKFYEVMKLNLDKLVGFKASLSKKAINSKILSFKKKGTLTHAIYDRIVFNKMRQAFGGRVRIMATGSAPISSEVIDFLKIANSCPFIEGYGQTEATGASLLTNIADNESGHTGGPLINTEFKLVNVPEMNYFVNNIGERIMGEILIRGPGVFEGYYKDEEKTKEVLDEDGWLHTGDIGMMMPNGGVKIIDRIKNIFKLSQGEFIAAEKIEMIFMKSKLISEIFIYGDSLESFIVAIVVPERSYILKLMDGLKIEGEFEDLCKNPIVVEAVLKEMDMFGKSNGLKGFELVKKVHLETESFAKKELYTSTFKLKRFMARQKYMKEIKEMYSK